VLASAAFAALSTTASADAPAAKPLPSAAPSTPAAAPAAKPLPIAAPSAPAAASAASASPTPAARPAPPAPTSAPLAPVAAPPKKPTAAERDAARALAEQGFEKLQAKKYADAIALFTKAEEHFHAPTHLFYIAQAHEKRGELIEAAEVYRKVAAETLARDAPQPFRDAQAQAGPALESAVRRTPRLRVDLSGAGAADARVTAGDDTIAPGVSAPRDPGTYLIRATAPDLAPAERSVVLREGAGEVVVTIELRRPISLAWPLAAIGLGLAAGGVSLGLGLDSHYTALDADNACRNVLVCPPEQLSKMALARQLRDASIGTGIAGGVALVAGITLLLVRPSHRTSVDPPDAAPSAVVSPSTVSTPIVALHAGPWFTGVTGSF
jgi:hypothetical protein